MTPRTARFALLITALTILGLAAAACGGGGGTLTVEEYFQRIDEIDTESAERSAAIEEEFDELTADAEDDEVTSILLDGFDQIFDVFEELGNELDDLNPPEEVEATHDEAVAAIEGAVQAFREARDDFEGADDILEFLDLFLSEEFDSAQQRAIDGCLALEALSEELENPVDLDRDE